MTNQKRDRKSPLNLIDCWGYGVTFGMTDKLNENRLTLVDKLLQKSQMKIGLIKVTKVYRKL